MKSVSARIAFLVEAALLMAAGAVRAQEADFIIRRVGWASIRIHGPERETVDLRISNRGRSAVNALDLSVEGPAGWLVSLDRYRIENLGPGTNRDVTLMVAPPRTLFADQQEIVVTASTGTARRTVTIDVTALAPRATWPTVGAALGIGVIVAFVLVFKRTTRDESAH